MHRHHGQRAGLWLLTRDTHEYYATTKDKLEICDIHFWCYGIRHSIDWRSSSQFICGLLDYAALDATHSISYGTGSSLFLFQCMIRFHKVFRKTRSPYPRTIQTDYETGPHHRILQLIERYLAHLDKNPIQINEVSHLSQMNNPPNQQLCCLQRQSSGRPT